MNTPLRRIVIVAICCCGLLCCIPMYADDTTAGEPSITTKWTPNLKDGTINLEVKNTGKTLFQFEPTPIYVNEPSLTFEHDNGLCPYVPMEKGDKVIPVVTCIGRTFVDDRGVAENGGFEWPITVQPNESKTITIPFGISAADLATKCDRIIISLFFNGVKIYKFQMKRNDNGVWKEEK